MGCSSARITLFIFALTLMSVFVLADDISVMRGSPVLLTTDCIINGQLFADMATMRIIDINTNVTILNTTNMTMVSPGIFIYNHTFSSNGGFLALQECFFQGGTTAEGSDDISVTEPWTSFILPGLGIVFLIVGQRRRTFLFFAAVAFLLTPIISHTSILLSLIFLLLSIACFFQAFKKKE